MKSFANPKLFAEHLAKLAIKEVSVLQAGLDQAAKLVEKEAKNEIGHLQPAVGSFNKWDELADSTKEDKERKGYVFNDEYNPLLREGDLRNSYKSETKGYEAVIGSQSDIAVYHEFGTSKMPARPVLGPAAFKNKERIKSILGAAAITGIIGEDSIHPSLGYDFDTKD